MSIIDLHHSGLQGCGIKINTVELKSTQKGIKINPLELKSAQQRIKINPLELESTHKADVDTHHIAQPKEKGFCCSDFSKGLSFFL